MPMRKKKFVFKNKFTGEPKLKDFELVEEDVQELKDGEVLFVALFLSVDPYMRLFASEYHIGDTMFGQQVAWVADSKHRDYKNNDIVVGYLGWATHTVTNPDIIVSPFADRGRPYKVKEFAGYPPSICLGVLGLPGYTAYLGLIKVLSPKPNDVLVITAAAGAVGSIVAQIAKTLVENITVIGFTGSDEKVKFLKEELKLDYAFNYKNIGVSKALNQNAKNGVDLYFDNVGGDQMVEILNHVKKNGRVAICGAISTYNASTAKRSVTQLTDESKRVAEKKKLKMQTFSPAQWQSCWQDAIQQLAELVKDKKIIIKETITTGFENMPKAFIGLFHGDNIGKAIIKIDNGADQDQSY